MKIIKDLNWYKVYSQIVKNIGKPCVCFKYIAKEYKNGLFEDAIGFWNNDCFIKTEEEFEYFRLSFTLSKGFAVLECETIKECEKIFKTIDKKVFCVIVFNKDGKIELINC